MPNAGTRSPMSSTAAVDEEPPLRAFVAARQDLAELGELADLEKVSVLTYNVLSQMGARRMLRGGKSPVSAAILNIRQRRERLLRSVWSLSGSALVAD
jgi:mRNA deadenylase 3'-5' endonuclease subunit Ccr4